MVSGGRDMWVEGGGSVCGEDAHGKSFSIASPFCLLSYLSLSYNSLVHLFITVAAFLKYVVLAHRMSQQPFP
jgi:hypothetical protein